MKSTLISRKLKVRQILYIHPKYNKFTVFHQAICVYTYLGLFLVGSELRRRWFWLVGIWPKTMQPRTGWSLHWRRPAQPDRSFVGYQSSDHNSSTSVISRSNMFHFIGLNLNNAKFSTLLCLNNNICFQTKGHVFMA